MTFTVSQYVALFVPIFLVFFFVIFGVGALVMAFTEGF